MSLRRPGPISDLELAKRQRRVEQIARRMGFVGRVEYRHVYSQTGGAQFGLARNAEFDLLTVSAEAFEKDSDPREFSLEAMIAHERGHQMIHRHQKLQRLLPESWTDTYEEILASVLGALLVETPREAEDLLLKACFDSIERGLDATRARSRIEELFEMLRRAL